MIFGALGPRTAGKLGRALSLPHDENRRRVNLASPIVRVYRQTMNPKIICLLAAVSFALAPALFAAGGKTYEITGTVVAATGTTLAIQKGTEKYEFAIDPATIKGSAELKVGSSVTVTYLMSAIKLESGAASSSKEEAKASPSP